jgi:hypothetical protein
MPTTTEGTMSEMSDDTKARIDAMGYEEMLRLWRNAPVGHPMFQGATGDYFGKRMQEKKTEVGGDEAVRASKNIGWNG